MNIPVELKVKFKIKFRPDGTIVLENEVTNLKIKNKACTSAFKIKAKADNNLTFKTKVNNNLSTLLASMTFCRRCEIKSNAKIHGATEYNVQKSPLRSKMKPVSCCDKCMFKSYRKITGRDLYRKEKTLKLNSYGIICPLEYISVIMTMWKKETNEIRQKYEMLASKEKCIRCYKGNNVCTNSIKSKPSLNEYHQSLISGYYLYRKEKIHEIRKHNIVCGMCRIATIKKMWENETEKEKKRWGFKALMNLIKVEEILYGQIYRTNSGIL